MSALINRYWAERRKAQAKEVEHCAGVARGRAARILHVVGNPHAEGFYVTCGFRTAGAVETRFGAGLAMQREL